MSYFMVSNHKKERQDMSDILGLIAVFAVDFLIVKVVIPKMGVSP